MPRWSPRTCAGRSPVTWMWRNGWTGRAETLGAEAVDAFYVVGADGRPVTDAGTRGLVAAQVLAALTG
jgi:hypothetical protein